LGEAAWEKDRKFYRVSVDANVRYWPKADLNFSDFWGAWTSAFGKSGHSPCTIYISINSPNSHAEMTSFAGHPLPMLTQLYIEALLVDEEAADAVWEAWDKGEIGDVVAAWAWWRIVVGAIAVK